LKVETGGDFSNTIFNKEDEGTEKGIRYAVQICFKIIE